MVPGHEARLSLSHSGPTMVEDRHALSSGLQGLAGGIPAMGCLIGVNFARALRLRHMSEGGWDMTYHIDVHNIMNASVLDHR
jgi:hypothetical protein